MSDLTLRSSVLQSLLTLDRPIEKILVDLVKFPWDEAPDLVLFERRHIQVVLKRCLRGELDISTIEKWADSIEMRDDIDLRNDQSLIEALFTLANPEISGKLNDSKIIEILTKLDT